MSARAIAYQVLLQVERSDAYLNVALDAALRAAGALPRQEAALATELSYGVARRALALDAALTAHSSRPLRKIDTAVHVALQLGAYQLLYLDRIPEHSAVDETVELVKRSGLSRAAGFVNAVLRKVAANKTIPFPEDRIERLCVEESHPGWLVRRWATRFGIDDAAALCRVNNTPPPVCVRVNSTRATREQLQEALAAEGVTARPTPLSPVGLLLENPGSLAALKAFREGIMQVQDEAAQLVSLVPAVRPGMTVLDACAAPGGKACHLAERLGGQGDLFAIDLHRQKIEKLQLEANRLGVSKVIHARVADASRPLPFGPGACDVILLDAPCSGLGTLRRHPELRYRRSEADIGRLAEIQRSLWRNLLQHLKPGGSLVYAVCSMEPEEGPEQAQAIAQEGGLQFASPEGAVPWESVRSPEGGIATFPHKHQMDGFYATRLVRPAS